MNTNMHNDELKEESTEGDLKDGVCGKYYAALPSPFRCGI